MEIGKIDISNLTNPPEKHEWSTAKFFAEMGKDVSFIEPSNIPEVYRPDILMDGIEWEIKSPEGKGKRTIERNFHKAAKQSKYIIFDLRRINIDSKTCLSQIKREFDERQYIRQVLVITKSKNLVKFSHES